MRLLPVKLLTATSGFFVALLFSAVANASANQYEYHAVVQYPVNAYDLAMSENTGDIRSSYDASTDPYAFITKEMWRATSSSEWTEMGEVDGDMWGSYYNGGFVAYQTGGQYKVFQLSGAPMDGQCHTFDLNVQATSSYVDAYFDGSYVATLPQGTRIATNSSTGIESNDTNSPYVGAFNQNNISSNQNGMQVYTGGSSWTYFPLTQYITTYNDTSSASNPISLDYTATGGPPWLFFYSV